MAFLNSTKYSNNIRAVSGLGVMVFPDDVVLNCNTNLGVVSIDLLEIPANYWNTTYKLYVNDEKGNAGVNNITINAPVGNTINGAASVVINTNFGSVLIRVNNNGSYMATYNAFGGSGYNTIEDEGVALPQRTIMNFIGAGVTASDVGGKTQVQINGGIIDITNAAILALIAANTVIVGQYYRITDVTNADLGVVVQGVRTNGVTAYGTGIFLNADYQGVGNYSSIFSFGANLGIWNTTPVAVVAGDVVIYNNQHYLNQTGAWGTAPVGDAVNWSLLPKILTTGYILACDYVRYNITANRVVYRADNLQNEVDHFDNSKGNEAIRDFQWGRTVVYANKVIANGIMACTNSKCTFIGNSITNGGIITSNTGTGEANYNVCDGESQLNIGVVDGVVSYNTLNCNSTLTITNVGVNSKVRYNFLVTDCSINIDTLVTPYDIESNNLSVFSKIKCLGSISGNVSSNVISQKSELEFSSISVTGSIVYCQITAGVVNLGVNPVTVLLSELSCIAGYSNWEAELDFATAILVGTVLTIPTTLSYVGKFKTTNSFGLTVTEIINLPTNHPSTLIPDNAALPNDFTLQYTAVGLAIANQIIRSFAAASDTFTAIAGDGSDMVILDRNGIFNRVLEKYNWQ
jgi:hypothetical protein